jgi:hypothetical protein
MRAQGQKELVGIDHFGELKNQWPLVVVGS